MNSATEQMTVFRATSLSGLRIDERGWDEVWTEGNSQTLMRWMV